MFSQLIAGTNITALPVAGLLIFFVFTLAVYWWTFHPKRRDLLQGMASMALDEAPENSQSPRPKGGAR